jgi:MYXO-CTERM domain-containing protein
MMNFLSALVVAASLPFTPVAVHHLENADGTLRAETGVLSPPMPQDVRDAARAFAQGRSDLRLPPGGSYGPARAFSSRYWATVRMPQLVDGVEVSGAELVVSFDRSRRVMQVSSSVQRYEGYTTFSLSAEEAHQRAGLAVDGAVYSGEGRFYGGVKRQYVLRGTEARAAYLAWIPTLRPDENWYVAVDAVSGEVLFKQNRVHHGFAANVYASSPGGKDGGVGVTATQQVDLQNLDGGALVGTFMQAWNCCTNEGCVEGAGPKRIQGNFNFGGFQVPYDLAVCDRLQRASNETSGDYLYTPVDPPNPVCVPNQGCTVRAADPADEDLFAEAHAYHHVDRVYAWTRTLASAADTAFAADNLEAFQLRDADLGKVPSVWANALMPNTAEAQASFFTCFGQPNCKATASSLMHLDNAAFLPREQFSGAAAIPGISFDTDALVIWQGDKADFSYDAPVLWHEFGHGMIYSRANIDFGAVASDARSVNNEGGALHEGLADYIAVAYGNDSRVGAYVGPRIDGVREQNLLGGNVIPAGEALRDADNPYKCPDVLWGEVHQDGMHLTAALWDARKGDFAGTDGGATFDAVVYAAIVSLAPNAGFAEFAAAVVARVQLAFPSVAGAPAKMQAVFDNRGITGCSKVVDISGKAAPQRPLFFIADASGAGFARTAQIPGPVQFKMTLPKGAKSVTVSFPAPQDPLTGQAQRPEVKLLARYGDAITFTRTPTEFTSDATASGNSVIQGSSVKVTANIDVPCGQELYLALTGAGGPQLQGLSFTTVDADSCPVVDAGTPEQPADAGTSGTDAGIDDGGGSPAPKSGCGCGATDAGAVMLPALALLALRRRRTNTAR